MADSTLNSFNASGTAAEMAAFTPSPPTPASGPDPGYVFYNTDDGILYSWDGAAWAAPAGTGNVTHTGTLTSGVLMQGNGGADITVNALTAQFVGISSGTPAAASMSTARLLGRTTAASGAVEEISVGTGLSLSAGSLTATASGSGWTQLAQVITSASQATVDFTSISGSYSNLVVQILAQDTTAGTSFSDLRLKVNNDGTSGNYATSGRAGSSGGIGFSSGIAASAAGSYIGALPNAGNTGIAGQVTVTIVGYQQTTFHKMMFSDTGFDSSVGPTTFITSGRWLSTAAITRLTFGAATAFTDGSIFTLYGVL